MSGLIIFFCKNYIRTNNILYIKLIIAENKLKENIQHKMNLNHNYFVNKTKMADEKANQEIVNCLCLNILSVTK